MDIVDFHKYPYISLDTETTGLVYPINKAFSVAMAAPDGQHMYTDLRQEPWNVPGLRDFLQAYNGIVIAHNVSFDVKMLVSAGTVIKKLEIWDDTVIRALLIDEHLYSYRLDDLCEKYLGEKKLDIYQELADIFGGLPTRNVQIVNLPRAPVELVSKYACKDAILALRLWEWQRAEIAEQGIEEITSFERRLMPRFIRSELRGIRVDTEVATRAQYRMDDVVRDLQTRMNKLAGWEVNVNSGPQIKKMFEPTWDTAGQIWVANNGSPLGITKKGNPSIGGEYLTGMSDPKAELITDLRSAIKTRDTFLGGHVIGHSHNGRVYPNINQCKGEDGGTKWGRLSYTSPAMQQIPNRNKEVAAIVKPCFLPDEGHIWVDGDMASFEVRVFAHLINSIAIIDEYKRNPGLDLHQFVADEANLPRNPTKEGGANAKQLNLSMIFNQGNGATAMKMGLPWEWDSFEAGGKTITYRKAGAEAMDIINRYHYRVPGVKELMQKCKDTAERRGYLYTFKGRRIRFPNRRFSYKASGLLIQSTSAEYNKENWEIVEDELDGAGHMILNTHDSYSMSMPEDNWQEHFARVKNKIEAPNRARVPLLLDLTGTGTNWWDAIGG